jgi:hypothetical protein
MVSLMVAQNLGFATKINSKNTPFPLFRTRVLYPDFFETPRPIEFMRPRNGQE